MASTIIELSDIKVMKLNVFVLHCFLNPSVQKILYFRLQEK